jgi:hypothetical protein
LVGADERDGQTLGTESSSTTHSVQVGAGIVGQIIIDRQVNTLDINTSSENIGGNTDSLLELLELLVTTDTMRY